MLVIGDYLQNRYRVVSHLGRGGMGSVFEAWDERFDVSVALKEVSIDLSQVSDKQHGMVGRAFEREAKTLAKLHHEAFPHVIDYFSERGKQYLVMELVQGQDLAGRLFSHQGPFGLEEVLDWTYQLLDALDYLHTHEPPIIHRDLKPQNLKLTSRGKIKLLDFGIAKGLDARSGLTTITNQTFVAATLNYSPIEQLLRVLDPTFREVIVQRYEKKIETLINQQADARSDLYSLGATLYHFLTGVVPSDALKRLLDVWAGKPDPLAPPAQLNPQIPEEISAFLLKSLEIERDNRFSSAAEMQKELRQAVAQWQRRAEAEEAERARREEEERLERERREAAERERLRLEAERKEQERLRKIEEERQKLAAEAERLRLEAEFQERLRLEAEQKRLAEFLERQRLEQQAQTEPLPAEPQQQRADGIERDGGNDSDANRFATAAQLSNAFTKTSFLKDILPENLPKETASAPEPEKAEAVRELSPHSMPLFSAVPTTDSNRKVLWILPALGLLILLFGGGILGMWILRSSETPNSSAPVTNQAVRPDSRNDGAPTPTAPPVSEPASLPPSAPVTDITPGSVSVVSSTPETPKPVSDKPSGKSQRSAASSNPEKPVKPTPKPTQKTITLDDFLKQKP